MGYTIIVEPEAVTALDEKTGERFTVRHQRENTYDACVELAGMVGFDLEDG